MWNNSPLPIVDVVTSGVVVVVVAVFDDVVEVGNDIFFVIKFAFVVMLVGDVTSIVLVVVNSPLIC